MISATYLGGSEVKRDTLAPEKRGSSTGAGSKGTF
jgi:hypothetical protein